MNQGKDARQPWTASGHQERFPVEGKGKGKFKFEGEG